MANMYKFLNPFSDGTRDINIKNLEIANKIKSQLVPYEDSTYNIGSNVKSWNNIYGQKLYLKGIEVIKSVAGANGNIDFSVDGTMLYDNNGFKMSCIKNGVEYHLLFNNTSDNDIFKILNKTTSTSFFKVKQDGTTEYKGNVKFLDDKNIYIEKLTNGGNIYLINDNNQTIGQYDYTLDTTFGDNSTITLVNNSYANIGYISSDFSITINTQAIMVDGCAVVNIICDGGVPTITWTQATNLKGLSNIILEANHGYKIRVWDGVVEIISTWEV